MNDKFLELQQFYTYVVLNTETKNECENLIKSKMGHWTLIKLKQTYFIKQNDTKSIVVSNIKGFRDRNSAKQKKNCKKKISPITLWTGIILYAFSTLDLLSDKYFWLVTHQT